MIRWYCAYTKAAAEQWARTNLWEHGFDVYLPLYRKRRRHARRLVVAPAPLFPRYLFVRADLEERGARGIEFARGVSHLVGFGAGPTPVPERVIAELRAREGADGLVDLDDRQGAASRYHSGDRVRIAEGALLDSVGLFQRRLDRERVIVLLELLGRQTQVRVAAAVLERAD